eukprot:746392-Hanusia_phi.AAC.2
MGLQRPGHEALGVVEAGKPEAVGLALDEPGLEEVDAAVEVLEPRAEGLEGGISDLAPERRDLVVLEGGEHHLQLCRHHDDALDGLLEVSQGDAHGADEAVELVQLLQQHCIQRAICSVWQLGEEAGGMVLRAEARAVVREVGGKRGKSRVAHFVYQLLRALPFPVTARNSGLDAEDGFEDGPGLLQLEGDVSVGMHAEHLGIVDHGQGAEVVHQSVVGSDLGREVRPALRELVLVVVDDVLGVIPRQDAHEAPPVDVVGHSTWPEEVNRDAQVLRRLEGGEKSRGVQGRRREAQERRVTQQ